MERSRQPVIFGEVLFDKFPDGSVVPGGAPFNVAWHLQAFGMRPLLISRVGDDSLGRSIRQMMQEWGLSTAGLQMDSKRPTGTVEVRIHEGEPEFEILNDRAYDFIDTYSIPSVNASLLYHGTLIQRNTTSANSLYWLRDKFRTPVFLDVNLRRPWWDRNKIMDSLQISNWVKLNEAELDILVENETGLESRARFLLREHGIKQLIVTRGEKGAITFDSTGSSFTVSPESGVVKIVDSVGAGDAFSSVAILGNLLGWPVQVTMRRAQEFASAIVGIRGAIVNNINFYQPYIKHWNLFDS